eukprot:g6532.t1
MHGLIHVVLKSLVLEKFSAEAWAAILVELNIEDDAPILELKQYDDAVTVAGVTATAKVAGVPFDDALRVFGNYFVHFVHAGNHLRMLQSMGDDIASFLRNINHLHHQLERNFPDSVFPMFVVEESENKQSFTLSYRSLRGTAIAALVEGIIPELAKLLHGQDAAMTRLETPVKDFFVSWAVQVKPIEEEKNAEADAPLSDAALAEAKEKGGAWHEALAEKPEKPKASISRKTSRRGSATVMQTVHTFEEAYKGKDGDKRPKFEEADALLKKVNETVGISASADVLMRGSLGETIAAEWTDEKALDDVHEFWKTNVGDQKHFALSKPVAKADRFVSHSWGQPDNWVEVMGEMCDYSNLKATELCMFSKDLAGQRAERGVGNEGESWKDVTFWVDKTCIPQKHELLPRCVSLLEEFILRCDGIVVILTWSYFSRLWCVYEWAGFLANCDINKLQICADAFMRPSSMPFYIAAVENFSVAACKCAVESDRAILMEKLANHYASIDDFEEFVKTTAIAVLALNGLKKSARGGEGRSEFDPWVELAERLGFKNLVAALNTAAPMDWRAQAMGHDAGAGKTTDEEKKEDALNDVLGSAARGWRHRFGLRADQWFADQVSPVLNEIKGRAVMKQNTPRPDAAFSEKHETKDGHKVTTVASSNVAVAEVPAVTAQ